MPAVRIFSLYAATAVFFDFLLQVTAFVALLSLDSKRQENNRLDILCCIKEPKKSTSEEISCNVYIVMKYFSQVLLSDFVRPVVVSSLLTGALWRLNGFHVCFNTCSTIKQMLGTFEWPFTLLCFIFIISDILLEWQVFFKIIISLFSFYLINKKNIT